uniref:Zinc finger, CCHC-type n=1 Tax=Tanacetum cinerariifolium TaxID=118510 RepID=A0A6L2MPU9_TANCI|nr:zinc finger, CCHC-type [Tanacetum cinerariifolium]
MDSSITRFNIKNFDGKNDFGLWQIKMCALMVQQGCDAALEILPADMEAGEKIALMKKAYNTLILCLRDWVLQEVTKETTIFLYGMESLTMEDVLATMNSRELKKRTEGTKKEVGDGLYVKESQIIQSHLKRDCLKKKSSGFVKKGKRDQDYDSSNNDGNTYFGEALVVVRNDEMTELLGDNRTCTIKGIGKVKIQLHDGSSFILEDVRYVPGLIRSLISLGTLIKEGYTVKMQMGRIKQLGSKQVGFKQLGHKQVGFKQLGPGVETGVHGVHDEKRVWFEVELQGAQGDREVEVLHVSHDDVAVAQKCHHAQKIQKRLDDKKLQIQECTVQEVKASDSISEDKAQERCMITELSNQSLKSENICLRFTSQVDVNNDLSKPVTTHYLPRERESSFAKPHHMIAPSSSRYSSNDMVHNHYLEEAKKRHKNAVGIQDLVLIPTESDSLPHTHAQTTKTYYKHQDSRIKKAQVLKTKTSANSDIKDPSSETKLQGRFLASFQDDAKYDHVGQDTRSQGGKDDQD